MPRSTGPTWRDSTTGILSPISLFLWGLFDCATVHLLTTATLARLHQLYPQGRFEVPRFRPNVVVVPASGEPISSRMLGLVTRSPSEIRSA